jgi:purine-nucleoside/S-methyl-5'-thioadenosine phosphorylase / adenosine deaminase
LILLHHGSQRYLQFPHFAQFPELVHGIFTRHGGHSRPPYQSLNTSTSLRAPLHDDADNVVRNRALTLQALNLQELPCISLWQIHSANVITYNGRDEWRTDWAYPSAYERPWMPASIHKADALVTQQPGITIALSFADCAPLLLYDPVERVIAIAHGGWRGTARGISIAVVEAMHDQFGCLPSNIRAGIGPAIGVCCYEVSEDVRAHFLGRSTFDDMPTLSRHRDMVSSSAAFTTLEADGRSSLRLDLWETNRRQLSLAGLLADHIALSGICTCCHVEDFFSHRGENGHTGRFPVIMELKESA